LIQSDGKAAPVVERTSIQFHRRSQGSSGRRGEFQLKTKKSIFPRGDFSPVRKGKRLGDILVAEAGIDEPFIAAFGAEVPDRSHVKGKGKSIYRTMGDMGEEIPLEVQEMGKDSAQLYESKNKQKRGQDDIGRPFPMLPGKKIKQEKKALENDEDMEEVF